MWKCFQDDLFFKDQGIFESRKETKEGSIGQTVRLRIETIWT